MGGIIVGGIFVVILLLTLGKVTIVFDYKENIIFKVKYMFFPMVTIPAKKNKKKKPKPDKEEIKAKKEAKKAAKAEKAKAKAEKKRRKKGETIEQTEDGQIEENAEEKPKKRPALSDIFELVKLALDSVGKPLKRILKRTVFRNLALYVRVGGEDAAKTAIKFGVINIAVGNALGWLDTVFTLKKPDEIRIEPDFGSEETSADCYCEIKLVVAAALAFAFTLLGRAIKYYFTHKSVRTAVKKMV